jgi:hypothetical protein
MLASSAFAIQSAWRRENIKIDARFEFKGRSLYERAILYVGPEAAITEEISLGLELGFCKEVKGRDPSSSYRRASAFAHRDQTFKLDVRKVDPSELSAMRGAFRS